ncbi:von Willebrand factor A [Labrenzia sp. OB1]|nr:von Willebrand factor A [Labrenzia sp. OB1]
MAQSSGVRTLAVVLLAILCLAAPWTSARASSCSLALVLAMDGSASVDAREHALQLNGLANALEDPQVVEAIEAVGGIWVTSFEWSGRYQQLLQLSWQKLVDARSAEKAAAALRRSRRGFTEFPTAIGYALGHASVRMQEAPEPCARKVIDIAGDGINNEGFGPESAYRAFDFADITVNALVIAGQDTAPVNYYRTRVLKGPGAFVEVAEDYEDYAHAMKRKLLREIFGSGYAALR